MVELICGFRLDRKKCSGSMACMRVCPTQAIRVRKGKATLLPERCIDCGSCLRACPSGAISAATLGMRDFDHFKFKVAVPSPVLFGQFPADISPQDIVDSLLAIGFDAVWITAVEIEILNKAIREHMNTWDGRFPVISSFCPVVVRLIQVAYPGMVKQLLHLELPRELAGRDIKRKFMEELNLEKDDIGAIYLTSCQAKTMSILDPAEGVKSHLDGAIGISDLYNDMLAEIHQAREPGHRKASPREVLRSTNLIHWGMSEGQRANLHDRRYMTTSGISNVIKALDDIEKGKLRNLEFLEVYSCWGGCSNGNLTVENLYFCRNKLRNLMQAIEENDPGLERDVEERFAMEDLLPKASIRPRSMEEGGKGDLRERVKRIKQTEELIASLPGLNCGLCGAPSCKTLAEDIATGHATKDLCIFYSKKRLSDLRSIYLKPDEFEKESDT